MVLPTSRCAAFVPRRRHVSSWSIRSSSSGSPGMRFALTRLLFSPSSLMAICSTLCASKSGKGTAHSFASLAPRWVSVYSTARTRLFIRPEGSDCHTTPICAHREESMPLSQDRAQQILEIRNHSKDQRGVSTAHSVARSSPTVMCKMFSGHTLSQLVFRRARIGTRTARSCVHSFSAATESNMSIEHCISRTSAVRARAH